MAAGRPLRPVPPGSGRNKGVGSNTSTQMLARMQADVLDVGTDWLILFGGLNDVGAHAAPATATTISNLTAMYDAALAAGMKVITATIFPTDYMTTAAQKQARADVNTAIRNYVSGHSNIYLADWATTMESAPDELNDAYSDEPSGQKVHPNAAGATAMAGVLDDVLTARVTPI